MHVSSASAQHDGFVSRPGPGSLRLLLPGRRGAGDDEESKSLN